MVNVIFRLSEPSTLLACIHDNCYKVFIVEFTYLDLPKEKKRQTLLCREVSYASEQQ